MKEFFQDEKGIFSSTRLVMIPSIIFFFGTWIYSLITTGNFTPSWELVSFVVFVVLGKNIQKFAE